MYFSRIELNRASTGVTRLLKQMAVDDYQHHQFIWQLFEGVETRDFLHRREEIGNWPRYFTVSARAPLDTQGIWNIDTKPYTPRIAKGMTLAFSLRVNPVVTRKDESGKRSRHDVVMDRKRQTGFQSTPIAKRPSLARLIENCGLDWLAARAAKCGFQFEKAQVMVDGYEQHKSFKRGSTKPITFSTLDFDGLLTVSDADAFTQTLFTGIGPAKGLGCGLLMVRRT